MKVFFLVLMIIFSMTALFSETLIPLDPEHQLSFLTDKDDLRLELFPEYPVLLQVKLMKDDQEAMYLEITYKEADEYKVIKVPQTQEQIDQLRLKIAQYYDKTSKNQNGINERAFEDGKFSLLAGYSVLSLGYYSLSLPMMDSILDDNIVALYATTNMLIVGGIMINTRYKKIHYQDANFSVNMATRGIGHGNMLYYLITDNKNYQKSMIYSSLISGAEGAIAYNLSENGKLSLSQVNAIPLYHDVDWGNTASLLLMFNAYEKWNTDIKLGIGLFSSVSGISTGLRAGKKIDFTKGDATNARTNYLLGASVGLSASKLLNANKTFTGLLLLLSSNAGLTYGENIAKKYQLSRSDGFTNSLAAVTGALLGWGLSSKEKSDTQIVYATVGANLAYHIFSNTYGISDSKKVKTSFDFETGLNPFALNSDQPVLNLSLRF